MAGRFLKLLTLARRREESWSWSPVGWPPTPGSLAALRESRGRNACASIEVRVHEHSALRRRPRRGAVGGLPPRASSRAKGLALDPGGADVSVARQGPCELAVARRAARALVAGGAWRHRRRRGRAPRFRRPGADVTSIDRAGVPAPAGSLRTLGDLRPHRPGGRARPGAAVDRLNARDKLDLLVHSRRDRRATACLWKLSDEDWDSGPATSTWAPPSTLLRAATPLLRARGAGGSVVLLSRRSTASAAGWGSPTTPPARPV